MATLIICPVCQTRYETKAAFPPEGRKVRCSKCAHVWQAQPVTRGAEPAAKAAVAPAHVAAPPTPPQPQPAAVNVAMRGFAGIAPVPPPPPPPPAAAPGLTQAAVEADLAAQVARINAEAMAETPSAAEAEPRSGGIFSRLTRKAPPAPPPPRPDAGMGDGTMTDALMGDSTMGDAALGDASMGDASMGDASMGDASMGEASLGDASMGDAEMGIDPALAAQAFPEERPRRKAPSAVAIGWLVLALIVASVIGTLALAPSAVMSVLPGAARLYALVGMPVGARGLGFQDVRYGWSSEGGQNVLEVQGDVVNLTSAPLAVPTVVIALTDEKGEEISEWTTEVSEAELQAGQHAPFLRQIPSPPSNVRSVRVRFAKAE